MKKLINDPKTVVAEMLDGFVALNSGLTLLDGENIVLRADTAYVAERGEVALIAGGGAGHEPAHAGYVGPGLLTAAVSGDVFSSPSTDAVLAAIRAVAGPAGVLLIVKNYTGDRLNFGLAAEVARAEGIPVEMVLVEDDVALGAGAGAGRRGVAGTVLVHKVAGAAAAAGLPLVAVRAEAAAAAASVGTMGVAVSPCTVPGTASTSFDLAADEVELGLGIHGEAGARRARLSSADDLTAELLQQILRDREIVAGDEVALLVNNLGGTPTMELGIVARRALSLLDAFGIKARRAWCGTFLTALDMQGCSLSLMKLGEGRLARLDAPATAAAWPATPAGWPSGSATRLSPRRKDETAPPDPGCDPLVSAMRRALLHRVTEAVRRAQDRLTALDQAVGDGDLGLALARGATALERDLVDEHFTEPATVLRLISASLRRSVGGTSGPLYAVAALRAAEAIHGPHALTVTAWADAFAAACRGISALGGADVGDRTMLDALVPAAAAFRQAAERGGALSEALGEAVAAAREGAARTATLQPRRGRSSYLGARAVGHPDPGAEAVVVWLEALRGGLAAEAAPLGLTDKERTHTALESGRA
ncbi:dihydroxyacetone kinase subunit DhaK [Inquilinus limosus]|uniref:dihydroxyacetone kinase subunit DhaL n=1 Tax=Inquilinus limosus TaxID=171674 RepID=UPI003F16FF0E